MENKKKANIVKILLIMLAVIAMLGIAGIITLNAYRSAKLELAEKQRSKIPAIVCIGDSLTAGAGGDGINYPMILAEDLYLNGYNIEVQNLGIGGESTSTIAGRMGAIPFRVDEFVIASDTTPSPFSFIDEPGQEVKPAKGMGNGLNPCTIAGVTGDIVYDEEEDQYYFVRSQAGDAVQVLAGTEVETYASVNNTDGIFIIFMGENHGWNDDPKVLLGQQKAILEMQTSCQGKYLIVGLSTGNSETREKIDHAMEVVHKDKFVNVREYLSSDGPSDAGIVPSVDDLNRMQDGEIPECLRADDIHYNKEGYILLGNYMYTRISELGYLDDIKADTDAFMKKWGALYKLEIYLNKKN